MGNTATKVVVVVPKRTKQGKCPKSLRFGGKQKNGNSRKAYFAQAELRIARNKARRIAKEKKRQESCALKTRQRFPEPVAAD